MDFSHDLQVPQVFFYQSRQSAPARARLLFKAYLLKKSYTILCNACPKNYNKYLPIDLTPLPHHNTPRRTECKTFLFVGSHEWSDSFIHWHKCVDFFCDPFQGVVGISYWTVFDFKAFPTFFLKRNPLSWFILNFEFSN